MSIRSGTLALLTAAALLTVVPAVAQDNKAESHRHVSVSGQGETTVTPDRARLRLGVTHVSPDLATAEAKVNGVVRSYLAEAKTLGAKDEHISTAGISIQPEYQWDEKDRINRLIGYRVSRDMEVVIHHLDKLGDFVLGATKAGVNQVQPPQLESSKAKELQNQALTRATLDAQAKARLMAETLGVKLGPLHNLSANDFTPPPPLPKMMAMRSDAAFDSGNQEMGFSPGEIRFSASVNAEFDLIVP
ncbi:MAG: SIMPL domain-containing protein [Panacagrimonas sp.]